jgi:hypothetical protein
MFRCPPALSQVGDWDSRVGNDRGRYFEHAPVDVGDAVLTIRGVQYANGATGRSILMRLEESIQAGDDDLTSLYARKLAAMLQNFADTCDILDEVNR